MKTQEAAQFLDIASSTLRQWTLYEFKEFLSSEAQGDGSRRNFKSMDLRILSFIADLKKDNHTADEIRETLRQMKEGGWKNLPELPDVSEEQSRIEVMMSNAEVMIDALFLRKRSGFLFAPANRGDFYSPDVYDLRHWSIVLA